MCSFHPLSRTHRGDVHARPDPPQAGELRSRRREGVHAIVGARKPYETAEGAEHETRPHGDGRRHVEVKDLLDHAHEALNGRILEDEHEGREEGRRHDPTEE